MALIRHRQEPDEAVPSLFDWTFLPMGWWSRFEDLFRDGEGRQMLRVEEFQQDGTLLVRAEMPGIDPDKDVEISVTDGTLTIRAERTEEEETSKKHFHRNEIHYGAFARTLALPRESMRATSAPPTRTESWRFWFRRPRRSRRRRSRLQRCSGARTVGLSDCRRGGDPTG